MPAKQYIVCLTEEERKSLNKLTTTGKASARKINHARILLKADINQPDGGCTDQQISKALNISTRSIERVRQRFVEESLENALNPRPKKSLWIQLKKQNPTSPTVDPCWVSFVNPTYNKG